MEAFLALPKSDISTINFSTLQLLPPIAVSTPILLFSATVEDTVLDQDEAEGEGLGGVKPPFAAVDIERGFEVVGYIDAAQGQFGAADEGEAVGIVDKVAVAGRPAFVDAGAAIDVEMTSDEGKVHLQEASQHDFIS